MLFTNTWKALPHSCILKLLLKASVTCTFVWVFELAFGIICTYCMRLNVLHTRVSAVSRSTNLWELSIASHFDPDLQHAQFLFLQTIHLVDQLSAIEGIKRIVSWWVCCVGYVCVILLLPLSVFPTTGPLWCCLSMSEEGRLRLRPFVPVI